MAAEAPGSPAAKRRGGVARRRPSRRAPPSDRRTSSASASTRPARPGGGRCWPGIPRSTPSPAARSCTCSTACARDPSRPSRRSGTTASSRACRATSRASGRRATWPCRPSPGIIARGRARGPAADHRAGARGALSLGAQAVAGAGQAALPATRRPGRQARGAHARLLRAPGRAPRRRPRPRAAPRPAVRALRPGTGRGAGAHAGLPGRLAVPSPTNAC